MSHSQKYFKLMLPVLFLLLLASCKSKKSVTTASGVYHRDIPKQEVLMAPGLDGVRRNLVEEAMTWIGTPYVYGGHSRGGTDCSGLVMEVYKKAAGKKIPRSTTEQETYCKRIQRKQLLPGDLVFFGGLKGGGRVSHVGMYIGADQMIHASSSRGVMVSRIDDVYFGPRFHSAGQVPGIPTKHAEKTSGRVPEPVKIIPKIQETPEITVDQLDEILQQKVDSISNSLLFD